jgi:hypothetical protein
MFPSSGDYETSPILLGPLVRANLKHLKTETVPDSKSCVFQVPEYQMMEV